MVPGESTHEERREASLKFLRAEAKCMRKFYARSIQNGAISSMNEAFSVKPPSAAKRKLKELKDGNTQNRRLILSDKTSRNLFCFLMLNLSFAFVELFYGVWTNSLGLISDSFHMFFDCTALLAGLAASVITKWRANERYPYGYVRAEVLAGFVNGLFLLFIAFFIFSEAVERAIEPPEVKHERLFVVSVLGFLVNLVGIFAFQHGHGHTHGGADHGHNHSHSNHGHSHEHGHSHDYNKECKDEDQINGGNSQIMHGVFLHILADTLGSVGVIISAILMNQFGWMIADPICSMFISTLIAFSVLPLLSDSTSVLMQRTPKALDNVLPGCYQRVMQLNGVITVQEPRFWTLCSNVYIGTLKLEVSPTADARYLLFHTHNIFTQVLKSVVTLTAHLFHTISTGYPIVKKIS